MSSNSRHEAKSANHGWLKLKPLSVLLLGTFCVPQASHHLHAQEMTNMSTRAVVGTGDDVLIAGFIIGGTSDKTVLVRALGPTLGQSPYNVPGVLDNPTLMLFSGQTVLDTCDDWQSCPSAGQIPAGLEPPSLLESAIVATLAPGEYTAIVSGVNSTTGVALVEVYDVAVSGGGTFSLSGTIFASAATAMDSDVNDPLAPFTSNDTPATVQTVPSPVTLGGYSNVPGAGPEGRSQVDGDEWDSFITPLTEGATATLFIADGDGIVNDLDLYLFDSSDPSTPLDSSTDLLPTEQVTAPYTGTFAIVVNAYDGASNYVLVIGQGPTSTSSHHPGLDDEFVPGQMIVRFKDDVLPENASDSLALRAGSTGLEGLAGGPGREMLLELGQGTDRAKALESLGVHPMRASEDGWLQGVGPEVREKLETVLAIKALRRRADVEYAEPNYIRHRLTDPNDEYYSYQWHYPLINLPQAWDVTTGSNATVVAVIDTGVLANHPDLQGSLLTGAGSGYDFIKSPADSNDGDGIDPDWNDSGDRYPGGSSSFHGTHVAGTIAAATNNRTGVAGVDWNAWIMPVRVLGIGGGTSYDILQGVRYAASLANDSGTFPQQTAAIMNLSLGGLKSSQAEQDVFTLARNAGVIIIAAAGNESSSVLFYPASYDGVVSVSAVDLQKDLAPYSNFGTAIDVAAPGGDVSQDINGDGFVDGVLSTVGDDSSGVVKFVYAFGDGTSMASPHMAGVVSLMKAIDPTLTPAELDAFLAAGSITEDLGAPGRDDQYGDGLIDALEAVVAAGGPAPNTPVLVVNPSALNFGLSGTEATLSASNAGGGSLTINNVANDSGGWLTVTATDVDANNLGTYTAAVDRSVLVEGAYAATITFASTAGDLDVPVVMQVGTGGGGGSDAGFHYVLLADSDTFKTVAQFNVGVSNGNYDFTFSDVPAGSYVIVAGTDSDNDNFICDTGEACGGYPVFNEIGEITVGSDLSGLDFDTSFVVNLGGADSASPVRLAPQRGFRLSTGIHKYGDL